MLIDFREKGERRLGRPGALDSGMKFLLGKSPLAYQNPNINLINLYFDLETL